MPIYLVRHAQAGERHDTDDDHLRPLTDAGRNQAAHLAERFAAIPVPRVVSSPFVRCVQTVAPVAAAHQLPVERSETLAEGSAFASVIDLLVTVADHTVLCSHGDVIPDTVAALVRRGMDIVGPEDWRKGSTWVLERNGDTFAHASVWAPPPQR
jgi:8-oxo-dGTP diphosphatase